MAGGEALLALSDWGSACEVGCSVLGGGLSGLGQLLARRRLRGVMCFACMCLVLWWSAGSVPWPVGGWLAWSVSVFLLLWRLLGGLVVFPCAGLSEALADLERVRPFVFFGRWCNILTPTPRLRSPSHVPLCHSHGPCSSGEPSNTVSITTQHSAQKPNCPTYSKP